jgi:hypothetical protein
MKFLWVALLALPLLVAALVYGRTLSWCHRPDAPPETAENSDQSEPSRSDGSESCGSDNSECCRQQSRTDAPMQTGKEDSRQIDPDRQIVFKVEGFVCPAVKGIGCGHMLRPVLTSLDEVDGVAVSSANYTGTMIRISAATAAGRDRVAESVRKVLAKGGRQPAALAGDELKRALGKEQWREARRVGELPARPRKPSRRWTHCCPGTASNESAGSRQPLAVERPGSEQTAGYGTADSSPPRVAFRRPGRHNNGVAPGTCRGPL